MKYALVALALAASARAQSRDDIPECAIPCIDDAITSETDCETTDFACACANIDSIQGAATGCVLSECGSDVALNEVLPAIEALCAAVGDGGSTTAEPTVEPTAEPTEEPTEEPTMPTIEPTEEPTEEPTVEPTETPSTTPTVIQPPPTNTPAPTGEPTPIPTGGAAALGHIGAIAMAAMGVLAL